MDKTMKVIAVAAAAMFAVGLLMAGVGYLAGGQQSIQIGRDGIRLESQNGNGSKGKLAQFRDDDLESFSNIDIDLGQYDVDLIPSDQYALEYTYSGKPEDITYSVENDTLVVKGQDLVNINIDILDFSFSNADGRVIKVYYPKEKVFGDVTIHCGAADLAYENLSAENIVLDLDFGELDLNEVTADMLTVEMDSGDCSLTGIEGDQLHISNNFGQVTLKNASLKTLEIDADSGDVNILDTIADRADFNLKFGELSAVNFTTKGLEAESSSGDVDLQGTFTGKTEITCIMGQVTVDTDLPKDQYQYELDVDMGAVFLDGEKVTGVSSGTGGKTAHLIQIDANMGDIYLNFK